MGTGKAMIRKQSLLDNVRIAAPCPALWSEMEGDDKMRHCKLCKLNVYDTSAMTRQEAENLIRESSGRLCMRLYRRPDGRLITKDCPVGQLAVRRRMAIALASGAAVLIAGLGKAASIAKDTQAPADGNFGVLYASAKEKLLDSGILGKKPSPPPAPTYSLMAGRIAVPFKATPVAPTHHSHPKTP